MTGCRETLDNMNFCWDAKTFDTAMLMFPDHPVYSWILLNENAMNVEGMRQAENWTSMDDVCAGVSNAFEIEQEGIYLTLSSMRADQFSCVQGYEFQALNPLFKYLSGKDAFSRGLAPAGSDDETIDADNALAILAQSQRTYFTDEFSSVNARTSTAANGFENGVVALVRGFAPYSRPAIGEETEPQWLPNGIFDKAIEMAVADGAINEHEGKLYRAFKRMNNGMTALEKAKAAKTKPEAAKWVAFAQSSMKEAAELLQQVNPNMLGVAMRQVYTEVKATFDPATVQTVEPKKIAKKEETKKDEKKKDEKKDKKKDEKKGDGGFDCDTKPQVYLFWSKDKKDAFKANCRK